MNDLMKQAEEHPPRPFNPDSVEPWLRNTHTEIDALRRQVLHALELTREDAHRWAVPLTPEELNSRPFNLPSVAFQLLHIARSLDRLLTYAEGDPLSDDQRAQLTSEHNPIAPDPLFLEFYAALDTSADRILAFPPDAFEHSRWVGRDLLPTTLGGLLIHCAEHTQRHTGQFITTAKLLVAGRAASQAT